MRVFVRTLAVSLAVGLVLVGCGRPAEHPAKPKFGTWGVDMADMDRSVRPGNDFFDIRRRRVGEEREDPCRQGVCGRQSRYSESAQRGPQGDRRGRQRQTRARRRYLAADRRPLRVVHGRGAVEQERRRARAASPGVDRSHQRQGGPQFSSRVIQCQDSGERPLPGLGDHRPEQADPLHTQHLAGRPLAR